MIHAHPSRLSAALRVRNQVATGRAKSFTVSGVMRLRKDMASDETNGVTWIWIRPVPGTKARIAKARRGTGWLPSGRREWR